MQESQEAFLEEMLLTLHILVHPQCCGYSGMERCAQWLTDRESLACSRTHRESREPWTGAARPTDLQLRADCGYRSEGYQQTNIIPGKCHSWALPLGASGEASLLPQRMQILAPGWCLYDRLSWQLTPAPTSGARVQSLDPRTKILHALGWEKACKREI